MSSSQAALQLVRNTVVNGLGSAGGILTGLLLTPLMIDRLGLSAYGVWALALTLTFAGGHAALSELGIEGATVRYVAESQVDRDLEAISRTVSTSLAVFCVIAVLVASGVTLLAHPLVLLFGVPSHIRPAATICFTVIGAQLAFEIPARAFVAVLEGTQRFVVFQQIEATRTVLQALLSLLALLSGWGIVGLACAVAASSFSSLVVLWLLAHRAVPGLRASPFGARRSELGRLVKFGGGVFVLRLVSTIYNQMDRTIIGIVLGPAPVGLYDIASKANLGVSAISSASVSALVPAAAAARGDKSMLRDMYLRGSCYATAASLPFAVAALIFARPLLVSWIGPTAAPAVGAARLFMVYAILQTAHNVGSTMLFGIGRIRFPLLVNLTATILNLVLSVSLVHSLGISGVIVGTLIANGLAWPLFLRYYLKLFECPLRMWVSRLIAPNLPGAIVQVCASLVLYQSFAAHTRSLALAAGLAGLSVSLSLTAFLTLGLRGADRQALLDVLRALAGRTPRRVAA